MMSRAAQTHLAGRMFETPDLHQVVKPLLQFRCSKFEPSSFKAGNDKHFLSVGQIKK